MAGKTSDWRPGPTVCRCCLTEGCYKDISTEYFWMGKREVYAEMLSDTFNVSISYAQTGGRLICEPCIARLRDASDFKRQVQDCEKTFMIHLDPSTSKSGSVQIEVESVDDVKMERVKVEKDESDDDDFPGPDFGDDDDDDDLDDEPLQKYATAKVKVPKKEAVEILDMLDTSQITVKRKASSKTKEPPKKVKKKEVVVKPTTSKAKAAAAAAEKKKKEKEKGKRTYSQGTGSWLTISERRNAANFITYTTVTPLVFTKHLNHKCFFCKQQFTDVEKVLEHTRTHNTLKQSEIFEKLLPKGWRTLRVDISELNCRICEQKQPDLETIKAHLINEHRIVFTPSGNGIIGYNLSTKNGQFYCHLCSKKFPTFFQLNQHMNVHFSNVVCETCGMTFLSHRRLKVHTEIHRPGGFSCKTCGKIYRTDSYLKFHMEKAHLGNRKLRMLRCRHCPEKFTEHFQKLKHLKEIHGITFSFDCEVCTATFPSRRSWRAHQNRIHSDKTKCEYCARTFGTLDQLRLHLVTHTGERNHSCKICQKTYRYSRGLRTHMKSIHLVS